MTASDIILALQQEVVNAQHDKCVYIFLYLSTIHRKYNVNLYILYLCTYIVLHEQALLWVTKPSANVRCFYCHFCLQVFHLYTPLVVYISYIYRNINEFCAVPNLAVIVVATGIKPQQSHCCVRVSVRRDNSIGPTTQRHEMVDCSFRISKFYLHLLSDADRAMFFG